MYSRTILPEVCFTRPTDERSCECSDLFDKRSGEGIVSWPQMFGSSFCKGCSGRAVWTSTSQPIVLLCPIPGAETTHPYPTTSKAGTPARCSAHRHLMILCPSKQPGSIRVGEWLSTPIDAGYTQRGIRMVVLGGYLSHLYTAIPVAKQEQKSLSPSSGKP